MTKQDELLALGKIAWLWASSPLHREWPVALQARFVLPAVKSGQFAIVEHDELPVAYCSWAFLDLDAERRYLLDPNAFQLESWNCGDRLWFLDWISPFQTRFTRKLRAHMADQFPDHLARALRVKKGSDTGRIATFAGTALSSEQGNALRKRYFREVTAAVANDPTYGENFELLLGGRTTR